MTSVEAGSDGTTILLLIPVPEIVAGFTWGKISGTGGMFSMHFQVSLIRPLSSDVSINETIFPGVTQLTELCDAKF